MNDSFESLNSSKANFDDVYHLPDPRGYFSVLGSLDYVIPDLAEPIVRQLLAARARKRGQHPVVLDVGCSYGINAAVQRFPVSFSTLRNRYARGEMAVLGPQELARWIGASMPAGLRSGSRGSLAWTSRGRPSVTRATSACWKRESRRIWSSNR